MDLINEVLNIAVPPFTFLSFCLLLPPFQFLKFCLSILNSFFSEDVTGKVVIITGASSGIGEYARRGAYVVVAARRQNSLREVANRCLELGSPDSLAITADVSVIDDCKRIVDSTITHFGRLDHLVSNAGITSISMLEDYDDITITRSVMASKAAMLALYETLRVELGADILITLATPGIIESEMMKGKHLAREGERHVTESTWYKVFRWCRAFWPELIEWVFWVFYLPRFGDSPTASLSKRLMDLPGLRALVYPSSVYSPGVKTK
ncbi:11-beta-hydroxysteroid dehydrogenase 1B [Bienertia sinuspersici]